MLLSRRSSDSLQSGETAGELMSMIEFSSRVLPAPFLEFTCQELLKGSTPCTAIALTSCPWRDRKLTHITPTVQHPCTVLGKEWHFNLIKLSWDGKNMLLRWTNKHKSHVQVVYITTSYNIENVKINICYQFTDTSTHTSISDARKKFRFFFQYCIW